MTVETLITDHIDIWSSALQTRSTAGRGSNGKIDLYGIKKLRELILELAVRGKLVPQDPNDEPASDLLKRIAAEKTELVKQGKIKKQKPLPEISEDEKPFELPEGWEWVRLGELFNSIASGGTPSKSNPDFWNGDIPWASVKDLGKEKYIAKTQDYISHQGLNTGSKLADEGDILICTRMGLGKIGIASCPVAFNQDLKSVKLTSGVSLDFFFNTYSTVKIKGTGTTVEGIKQEQLLNYVIGLPSGNEQHQIVEKVDELMSLCDQLEQQSLASLDAHQQLVETLLATLTDSQNTEELADNWARISQHFDTLFTTEASIDALKQTILQLAVMGKLTKQVKADSVEYKTSHIDGLSIYNDINERIPKSWTLRTLDNISSAIIDCPHSTPKWANEGFICVRTSQIKPGYLELKDSRYVSEQTYKERIQRLEPIYNDILYSREGGVLGVACRIPEGNKICLGQRMMLIRPSDKVLSEYLEIVLNSPLITILAQQMTTGGAAPRVNVSTVKKYLIPLPSKEEQYKIVSRVNKLFALCETLKSRLQSAQQTQLHLAGALTDAALN
ncbi:restriction endonuclease subunit S [Pectobacterium aroidearum]|uniref:restriction endonuclease subunit S n=1 Tax=Pectobacterium aroidearum TaxID=1201031 RepID=UPI0032ED053C